MTSSGASSLREDRACGPTDLSRYASQPEALVPLRVAALYVQTNGCYFDLPGVDPWDKRRDARLYDGPYPVVAHPPCERWGRYWFGGPSAKVRLTLGDDGGCFAAALAAVRKFGGVLEHPEGSHAWRHFHLNTPPRNGAWVVADWEGGWTCCVEQGAYGHEARKATWLYANGAELPSLDWGKAPGEFLRMEDSYHSAEERRLARESGRHAERQAGARLSDRARAATPHEFRDLLLSIARSAIDDTHAQRGDAPEIAAPSLMSGGGAGTAIAQTPSAVRTT